MSSAKNETIKHDSLYFKKTQTHYWAFLPDSLSPLSVEGVLTLSTDLWPEKAHHWTRVSRARLGETVTLIAQAEQCLYRARFTAFSKQHCELHITEHEALPNTTTTIIACVPFIKPDRWEWLLEKLTELGVTDILPIHTRRAQYQDADTPKARARWERIILAAAEQSEQWQRLTLHTPIPLDQLPTSAIVTKHSGLQRLVPCERLAVSSDSGPTQNPKNPTIAPAPNSPVVFAIGPEGGWHEDELEALTSNGFTPYRLGPHVLRVETAAIAMASLIHERQA